MHKWLSASALQQCGKLASICGNAGRVCFIDYIEFKVDVYIDLELDVIVSQPLQPMPALWQIIAKLDSARKPLLPSSEAWRPRAHF